MKRSKSRQALRLRTGHILALASARALVTFGRNRRFFSLGFHTRSPFAFDRVDDFHLNPAETIKLCELTTITFPTIQGSFAS